MRNPQVTITRTGDTFTYYHPSAPAPVPISLTNVCRAAQAGHEAMEQAHSVVAFLRDSLKSMAESGNQLDESGMMGLVSICESMATILTGGESPQNSYMEYQIIEAIADGGVSR